MQTCGHSVSSACAEPGVCLHGPACPLVMAWDAGGLLRYRTVSSPLPPRFRLPRNPPAPFYWLVQEHMQILGLRLSPGAALHGNVAAAVLAWCLRGASRRSGAHRSAGRTQVALKAVRHRVRTFWIVNYMFKSSIAACFVLYTSMSDVSTCPLGGTSQNVMDCCGTSPSQLPSSASVDRTMTWSSL